MPKDTFSKELVALIPAMRRWAWSLTRRRDLVDDIVQDALVRALASEARFIPGSNLQGWVWIIMRNAFITRLRATRHEAVLDETTPVGSCGPAQYERMQLRELGLAMGALSPGKRKALLAVGLAGMAYDEAAEICGCGVGTLKSRVSRARTELHLALNPETEPPIHAARRAVTHGAPRKARAPAQGPGAARMVA
ncbi:MAG: RNA polymerase subunit sigma [Phenylobacterium zucineum]|nr:MAG: RNA polymerase subunit sigma [Phenylobacterium zucineum]